jgi:hypothetical protein
LPLHLKGKTEPLQTFLLIGMQEDRIPEGSRVV